MHIILYIPSPEHFYEVTCPDWCALHQLQKEISLFFFSLKLSIHTVSFLGAFLYYLKLVHNP